MNKVFDDSTREAIALKRFSLISPVLNGQVKNQRIYFENLSETAHDMPYYGPRKYKAKTFMTWLDDYRKGGIEGLRPGYRKDRGKRRKIDADTAERIKKKRVENPRMPITVLYEDMVKKNELDAGIISLQTFYRFFKDEALKPDLDKEVEEIPEMLRYAFENVNECWQIDAMYGPYLRDGKFKRQTYLIAIIDDASRLIPNSKFYWSQKYEDLRDAFKEAVLKRGKPRLVYTDNGKIFKTQQFEYVCASIGTTLIHSQPFMPNQRGKIERYFKTVRERFLSRLDPANIKSIDELNERYAKWLDEDYQRKVHKSIGMSPLDYFMSQISKIKMVSDPAWLEEAFLLRTTRKVNHDATIQMEKVLYETDQRLAGIRVEVRYDPSWLLNSSQPLQLYVDGKKVGEAKCVNFKDNAHVRRKRGNGPEPKDERGEDSKNTLEPLTMQYSKSISFKDMMRGDCDCSHNISE